MDWYLRALKKYAEFTGRAQRKEYWFFVLFNIIFSLFTALLDNVLGLATFGEGYGPINLLYSLALLLPGTGVTIRRLHDVGKSGWFSLIVFIPLIGFIWLLILMCRDGMPGDNQYGDDPKA